MKKELTLEQQQAIKLQEEREKYRSHCVESSLFTQNPENVIDMKHLCQLTEQKKQLEKEIEELRHKIYDSMRSVKCNRALLMSYNKQLTISQAGQTASRVHFDVDAFKNDNPELYAQLLEQYNYRTGGRYTNGGTLTLSNIQPKAMSHYLRHSDYFEAEKPVTDSCGVVFSIVEFRDLVSKNCISDYDGFGEYLHESGMLGETVDLDDIWNGTHPSQYKWVVWYNK